MYMLLVFIEVLGLALFVIGIVALIRGKVALVTGLRTEGIPARITGLIMLLILPFSMGGRILVDLLLQPRTGTTGMRPPSDPSIEFIGCMVELMLFALGMVTASAIVIVYRKGSGTKNTHVGQRASRNPFENREEPFSGPSSLGDRLPNSSMGTNSFEPSSPESYGPFAAAYLQQTEDEPATTVKLWIAQCGLLIAGCIMIGLGVLGCVQAQSEWNRREQKVTLPDGSVASVMTGMTRATWRARSWLSILGVVQGAIFILAGCMFRLAPLIAGAKIMALSLIMVLIATAYAVFVQGIGSGPIIVIWLEFVVLLGLAMFTMYAAWDYHAHLRHAAAARPAVPNQPALAPAQAAVNESPVPLQLVEDNPKEAITTDPLSAAPPTVAWMDKPVNTAAPSSNVAAPPVPQPRNEAWQSAKMLGMVGWGLFCASGAIMAVVGVIARVAFPRNSSNPGLHLFLPFLCQSPFVLSALVGLVLIGVARGRKRRAVMLAPPQPQQTDLPPPIPSREDRVPTAEQPVHHVPDQDELEAPALALTSSGPRSGPGRLDFSIARPARRKSDYLPWLVVAGGLASALTCLCGGVGIYFLIRSTTQVSQVPFGTVRADKLRVDNFERLPPDPPPKPKPIVKPQPIQPVILAGKGISNDWQIVFRSGDPSIWDKDVNQGEQHFAKSLAGVPADIRFLRIRKDSEFVIVEMTRQRLKELSDDKRYGWNGLNHYDSEAHHLGVFDRQIPGNPRGSICIRNIPWYSGWGFGHIAFVNGLQGYCWEGKPIGPTVLEIGVKRGELTEVETKKLLKKQPPKTEPIRPVELVGMGISKDWQPIFRSGDPSIWNKNVNQGEQNFAKPLAALPDNIRYLRIRKDDDYVIVEMVKSRLIQASDDGRYGWNGTNQDAWSGHHLGIFDKQLDRWGQRGEVCTTDRFSGWGFGHFIHIDNDQAYCWNGKQIAATVLEIAVKPGELTETETKKLLKKKINADPIKPAKLEGDGISKDWQAIFCSADPRIWDHEIQKDENHFAKPLTAVPDDIRYLRVRRHEDFVIVEMTKARLKQLSDDGRFGWNGTNDKNWEGHHFGIFDKKLRADARGSICVRVFPHFTGWGFGHVCGVDKEQGYCWDGESIEPTVFEIAVKNGNLTNFEAKKLLK
jgi:hypothetical protein